MTYKRCMADRTCPLGKREALIGQEFHELCGAVAPTGFSQREAARLLVLVLV
jgi:hypothetical protein